jgi:ABC-type uncharacterized transport system substrate-binding protein
MKIILAIFNSFSIWSRAHGLQSRFNYTGVALLFSILILSTFPTITFAEKTHNILLIISSNSNAYETTARDIKATLNKINTQSILTRTLTIEEFYSQKRLLPENTDLFVPLGQRALKEVLKYSGNTPVLASLISKYDFDREIHNRRHPENNNIGAIYIDQPLDRHLLFSKLALPNVNRFSFIISNGNKHTIDKLNLLDQESYRIGILNPGDNVLSTLSHILTDADAIIAVPDPIIFNLRTTRSILLSTYRKRIPVIGFSESYVKAGALAAIYSTPEFIGKQTGEVISHLIEQDSLRNKAFPLPRIHAKYFSISVNKRVSRSLGLPVINEDSLEKDLLQIEKSRHK